MSAQSYWLNWRVPNPQTGMSGRRTITHNEYMKGVTNDAEALEKAKQRFAEIQERHPKAKFLKLTKKVTKTKILCRKLV